MHFGTESFVGFLESADRVRHVVRVLLKRLGVPFTARGGKKISAINVDRGRNLIERIRDSMDNRRAERSRVLCMQVLCSVLFQAMLGTAVKRILLETSIDADDGPHAMIVGFDLHP